MASRRSKWISASALAALAAGGYGLYLVSAQTAPPSLAQAPLNLTTSIPPAFIMGVDDSGSMTFQSLLSGSHEGAAYWGSDDTATQPYSYFVSSGADAGKLRTVAAGGNVQGGYVAPYPGPRASGNEGVTDFNVHAAIPPFDSFGFSRSPTFNRAYFNPDISYAPWKTAEGQSWPQANPRATLIDPNNTGGLSIDLTAFNATYQDTIPTRVDNLAFRLRRGMVVPQDTVLRPGLRSATCPGLLDRTEAVGISGWYRMTQDTNVSCNMDAYIAYFPATFYLPTSAPAPANFRTENRVFARNACTYPGATGTAECNMYRYEIKPENYGSTEAYTAAINNFANWFQYYGSRNRAMIAAVTNAMSETSRMRVGFFTINNLRDVTMRDLGVGAEKAALFNDVTHMVPGGATPNLTAVEFMGQQFKRTDAGAPVQLACQKNAGMLFTDGFSNGAAPLIGNVDGAMGVPFQDAHSGTMADIVSQYYVGSHVPLRTDAGFTAGRVPVSKSCESLPANSVERARLDCNTDLHMNFYGITLGARGAVYDSANPRDPFASPYIDWPAYISGSNTTVDDLWHATVNTRGEYINANTPQDITSAMRRILASVSEGTSPSGTMGLTGARVGPGSFSVTPSYESGNYGTDWYGHLQAETISKNATTGGVVITPVWEASEKLQAQGAAGRTIRFAQTSTSVVPTVSDFVASNLSFAALCADGDPLRTNACREATLATLAGGSMTVQRAVDYLRGSRTDEGVGKLRTRTSVLGDIVNSSPVVQSPTDNYGYASLGGTLASSYATFLGTKKTQNKRAVLVGANDGMFHIFNGSDTGSGGDEWFAYVPATSLSHMGNLLFPYNAADQGDQKFDHRYFVDGPITVSDVYDGSAWRTIAVGTSGAGGRSVFALDVTDPENPTVLWEINDRISGNSTIRDNIGYVLGRPVIVPVKASATATPTWKVVFSNGYNSNGQRAALFVVDAISGATNVITASEAVAPAFNGLGGLVAIDSRRFGAEGALIAGNDGFTDTVYAADQNGAVWKFNLQGNSVALGGEPLFVASNSSGARQSIMGGLTAALGPRGGVMLYFGTGSFSFSGDNSEAGTQTLYGILDTGAAISGRSSLVQQTAGAVANGLGATSTNAADFTKRGWYLDLPSGQRFVGNPRIESGVVFFAVYAYAPVRATDCDTTPSNWLYGLNSISGGASLNAVKIGSPNGTSAPPGTGSLALVPENKDSSAPIKDVSVLATPKQGALAAGALPEDLEKALKSECSMIVKVAGAPELYLPRPCGRQSWRQVRG